jgi:hypothetical protein
MDFDGALMIGPAPVLYGEEKNQREDEGTEDCRDDEQIEREVIEMNGGGRCLLRD